MRHTDIVIAGGGLAGSTAAAMLARDGFRVVLVDPHPVYPPDLRCEKLDGPQVAILRRTGLADAVLRAGTFDGECWIARFGRVIEKRGGDQYGILYDTLVNTIRAEIPGGRRGHQRQGHGDRQQRRPSDRHAVDRRGDFRAAGHRGERFEHRPASRARHDARGREPVPLDHDRVRSQAGRAQSFRFPGDDLLSRARVGPDGLHHAVPDRLDDARELHGLSRHERSVAARDAPPGRRRRCSR